MSQALINPFAFGGGSGGGGSCDESGVDASGFSQGSLTAQNGWRFTVGANDLEVCALRLHSLDNEGEHTLRLWRVSDEALLASVAMTPTGDNAAWGEAEITPVTLAGGSDYVVTQRRTDGATRTVYRNPSSLTINSAITLVDNRFVEADTYPTNTSGHDYQGVDIKFSIL